MQWNDAKLLKLTIRFARIYTINDIALRKSCNGKGNENMVDEVLTILLAQNVISGEKISRILGVTRSAVWKDIKTLREQGFEIEASERSGYHLVSCPDSLMAPLVHQGLQTEWAGKRIYSYDTIDSTNRRLRELAQQGAEHGTLVLADEQTGGRGRRGRGWITPKGEAIAMSLLMRPEIPPQRVSVISLGTAIAVAFGIRAATDLPAMIKWPNDVVVNGKKVCGILLELEADEQSVHHVVAGIGINVHQKTFPEEIAKTATSLDLESSKTLSRAKVVREILKAAEHVEAIIRNGRLLDVYESLSVTIGHPVCVYAPAETFEGTAVAVKET